MGATVSEPFISRDDLASKLFKAPGSLDDDELALIAVDAACDLVRDECQQQLSRVDGATIIFSPDGDHRDLLLPELPVEIDEVRVDGDVVLDWVLMKGGILRLTGEADWSSWPAGDANVEVDCDHGYLPDDLPRQIRLVALSIASRIYRQGIVRQQTTGATSVTYSVAASTDLSSGERIICRRHRVDREPTVDAVPAVS